MFTRQKYYNNFQWIFRLYDEMKTIFKSCFIRQFEIIIYYHSAVNDRFG